MTPIKCVVNGMSLVGLILAFVGSSVPAGAQDNTLAREEQRLLQAFRTAPKAGTLQLLAEVREEAGLFDKAEGNWKLLASRYGAQETIYYDENKTLTYAQLAAWMQHRLQRKRNLDRNGKASNQQFRRASTAQDRLLDSVDSDASRAIDMDGDGINEIVLITYQQNTDTPRWVSIYKWDKLNSYRPLFSTLDEWKNPIKMLYGDYEADTMRDGFGDITMILKDKPTIEGYLLMFNGRTFIAKLYAA